MVIDYNAEVQRLDKHVPGEGNQFWKPTVGQYRVKALTELEEAEPFHKEGEEDKPQAKVGLHLVKEDLDVTWTVAKGVTPASSYGQLCNLGKTKGKLKDEEFMIVVTSDNNKNSYTIVDI